MGARAHVWIGTPDKPVVVVAYARFREGHDLDFVTTATRYGCSDELVQDAFDNLEIYHTDFEVVEAGEARILVSAGWPFATERALCQSHMMLAHEKLDAPEIVISVARRHMLLACARDRDDYVRRTMTDLHFDTHRKNTSGGERVTDRLIVIREGTVVGSLLAVDPADNDTAWDFYPS